MKKNNKPIFVGLLIVLLGIIGGTIAYYTTNNTFTNEFNASKYIMESSEVFESPDDWMPGDTTPKQITVTNRGTINAAVRVYFEEKWEDESGTTLPLQVNNTSAAIVNYSTNYSNYWLEACTTNPNDIHYYYYYKSLAPNESTSALIDSVTFNPNFESNSNMVCTTDNTTHTQICTTTFGDYTGGKYTLTAHIETVQYNGYQTTWNNPQVNGTSGCTNLVIS